MIFDYKRLFERSNANLCISSIEPHLTTHPNRDLIHCEQTASLSGHAQLTLDLTDYNQRYIERRREVDRGWPINAPLIKPGIFRHIDLPGSLYYDEELQHLRYPSTRHVLVVTEVTQGGTHIIRAAYVMSNGRGGQVQQPVGNIGNDANAPEWLTESRQPPPPWVRISALNNKPLRRIYTFQLSACAFKATQVTVGNHRVTLCQHVQTDITSEKVLDTMTRWLAPTNPIAIAVCQSTNVPDWDAAYCARGNIAKTLLRNKLCFPGFLNLPCSAVGILTMAIASIRFDNQGNLALECMAKEGSGDWVNFFLYASCLFYLYSRVFNRRHNSTDIHYFCNAGWNAAMRVCHQDVVAKADAGAQRRSFNFMWTSNKGNIRSELISLTAQLLAEYPHLNTTRREALQILANMHTAAFGFTNNRERLNKVLNKKWGINWSGEEGKLATSYCSIDQQSIQQLEHGFDGYWVQ